MKNHFIILYVLSIVHATCFADPISLTLYAKGDDISNNENLDLVVEIKNTTDSPLSIVRSPIDPFSSENLEELHTGKLTRFEYGEQNIWFLVSYETKPEDQYEKRHTIMLGGHLQELIIEKLEVKQSKFIKLKLDPQFIDKKCKVRVEAVQGSKYFTSNSLIFHR